MTNVAVLNAKIGKTNFSGLDLTGFNITNARSFMLFVDDPELLEQWREEKVKIFEGENGQCFTIIYLPDTSEMCRIQTKFRGKEPKTLDPLSYQLLDICKISRAELVINEYHWSVHDRSGVKLYLVDGTFTINKQVNTSDVFEFFNRRKKVILKNISINNYGVRAFERDVGGNNG